MGIFDGCLLACDVDGTLIKGDYLPLKNIKAMDFFKGEGGIVCLSTGRTAPALTPIIEKYGGFGPSVVANGSMIYDIENDNVLYKNCLSLSAKQTVLQILECCPSVAVELHSDKFVTVISRTKESDDHEEYEKILTRFAPKEEIFNLEIQKALLLFTPGEDEKTVKNFLKNLKTDCDFMDSACTINGIGRRYLEQLPKGVSKAATLKRLCKMLKIEHKKLFAIGDYYNDLKMIEEAYISACPSESPEEIKKAATFTVCSASDGAVAEFIDILKGEIANGCKN